MRGPPPVHLSGMDAVVRSDLRIGELLSGDVLYYLLENYQIPDAPLWQHDGVPYWPWHTAMYAGNGMILQANPGDRVVRSPLEEMSFHALFVTRVSP